MFKKLCTLSLATALTFGAVTAQEKKAPPKVENVIADTDIIKFKLHQNLMFIEGEVNGVKGYFFVDSGAPHCVLNSAVVKGVKGEKVMVEGSDGKAVIEQGTVKSLKFGKSELKNVKAMSQNLNHIVEGSGIKLLGLLGYKELSNFEMVMNYSGKRLFLLKVDKNGKTLGEFTGPKPKAVIKYKQVAHLPIIECELNGEKLRMALDTGAGSNLMNFRLQKKYGHLLTNVQAVELQGVAAKSITVKSGLFPELKVGGVPFKNTHTVFTNIDHMKGLNIHGLIGFQVLAKSQMSSINFKKKELKLW